MKRFWIRRVLGFLGFAVLFVGLAGLAVMTLWNALLPDILGVTTITFGQALGLLILSRLLFGGHGFGRGGFGRGGFGGWRKGYERGRFGSNRTEWKRKMAERWQQMTPEQREQMKAKWRDRCGGGWGRGQWDTQPEQPAQNQPGEQNPVDRSPGSTSI